MTQRRTVLLASAAFLLGASSLEAQAVDAPRRGQGQGQGQGPGGRAQMERNLRRALWRVTKERVALDDSQMTRLDAVTRQLEPRRLELARRERQARQVLRAELGAAQPDEGRVARQLDELQAVQRGRVDLLAEEQRRLGDFMTAVQRARYFALQEQFRRRVEQLRGPGPRGGMGGGEPAGPPRRLMP